MFCEKCGTQLEENTQFCPNCGNMIANSKKDSITDAFKKITNTAVNTAKSAGNAVKGSINNMTDTAAEKNNVNKAISSDDDLSKTTQNTSDELTKDEKQEQAVQINTASKPDSIVNNKNIIVSTGDLKQNYEVIGPVYFQVSNKGVFGLLGSNLSALVKQYNDEIQKMKSTGQLNSEKMDWGFLYGEWSVGANDFDKAFFISVQELKKRAALLGADAVICMRQDIDIDTNGFAYFYLQMYGTAVKFTES